MTTIQKLINKYVHAFLTGTILRTTKQKCKVVAGVGRYLVMELDGLKGCNEVYKFIDV